MRLFSCWPGQAAALIQQLSPFPTKYSGEMHPTLPRCGWVTGHFGCQSVLFVQLTDRLLPASQGCSGEAPKPQAGRPGGNTVPALKATALSGNKHSVYLFICFCLFMTALCSHWCPKHWNVPWITCLGLGMGIPMEAELAAGCLSPNTPALLQPPLLSPSSCTGEIKDIF